MADTKTSAEASASTPLDGTELIRAVKGGVNVKLTPANILAAGTFQLIATGTTTNDSASAGQIGQTIASSVESPGVSLSTGANADVTTISLTAGDWVVSGIVYFLGAAATSFTVLQMGIGQTSVTITSSAGGFNHSTFAALVPGTTHPIGIPLPVQRISLSGTATIYMVAQATFSVSTATAYGRIEAHRVR